MYCATEWTCAYRRTILPQLNHWPLGIDREGGPPIVHHCASPVDNRLVMADLGDDLFLDGERREGDTIVPQSKF